MYACFAVLSLWYLRVSVIVSLLCLFTMDEELDEPVGSSGSPSPAISLLSCIHFYYFYYGYGK